MNEFELAVEEGRQLLRSEGVNFTVFKSQMRTFFHNSHLIDEDSFVEFYNLFAYRKYVCPKEKLGHWAAEFFQDFKKDENRYWLMSFMRKYI